MDGGKTRVVRPRILVYVTLLSILCLGFLYALFTRVPVELDVIRDRNALYREARPGFVENVYLLRVINKDDTAHTYSLDVAGLPTVSLDTDSDELRVAAGDVVTLAARVEIEDGAVASGGHDVEFTLTADDAPELNTTETSRFISP